jgi:hypothetical protein
VPVALFGLHEDIRVVLREALDATTELSHNDINIERRVSEDVRRYVRITSSDEDPPTFVMSYGDNDMDSRVWGTREFMLRVIKQFVVDLQPSSAVPRE